MNKLDQLLVRACKSGDPQKRLQSVYRRFYMNNRVTDKDLCHILSKVVDKYVNVKAMKLIQELSPESMFMPHMADDSPYWNQALQVLIYYIRFTEPSEFEGMEIPAMFRNE